MTDTAQNAAFEVIEGASAQLAIEPRYVDTMLVDSVVGFVTVGGVPRITLGQVTYKAPNELPRYVPVVTLAVTTEALQFLAAQFHQISQQVVGVQGGAENDETTA